jgi:hypothetical protein
MHEVVPCKAAARPISRLDELLAWSPGALPDEELCWGSVPLTRQVAIDLLSWMSDVLDYTPPPSPPCPNLPAAWTTKRKPARVAGGDRRLAETQAACVP